MRIPRISIGRGAVAVGGFLAVAAILLSTVLVDGSASAKGPARTHRVSQQLIGHIGLFRHSETTAAEAAAVAAAPRMARTDDPTGGTQSNFGLNVSQVREVSFGNSGSVWAVPGATGTCAVIAQQPWPVGSRMHSFRVSYGICASTANLLANGGAVGVAGEPDGSDVLYGIVVDGNSSIVVTTRSGASMTIPVTDNAVLAQIPSNLTSITANNADGKPVDVAVPGP